MNIVFVINMTITFPIKWPYRSTPFSLAIEHRNIGFIIIKNLNLIKF